MNLQRFKHVCTCPVTRLAYTVTCVHSLQMIVPWRSLLTVVQYLYCKLRMSKRSKCKSGGDVAILFKVLYCEIKDVLFFAFVFHALLV